MKNKKFYLLYKITNWYDGKIYIGAHSTNNIYDGYMGSGKYIKRAINKFGAGYFTKEILEFFNNKQEMYIRESEIVNDTFVKNPYTYNIAIGGSGGNTRVGMDPKKYEEYCSKISKANKGKTKTPEHKESISKAKKENPTALYGKANGKARKTYIYNELGEEIFYSHGNFYKKCLEENLPYSTLNHWKNKGPIICKKYPKIEGWTILSL